MAHKFDGRDLARQFGVMQHTGANKVRVPKLIEHVAREIAGAFYEDVYEQESRGVRSEYFRETYPIKSEYPDQCWPHWVKDARTALAQLLGQVSIDEASK